MKHIVSFLQKPCPALYLILIVPLFYLSVLQTFFRFFPEPESTENRPLASMPEVRLLRSGEYPQFWEQFQTYFLDNYGLKNTLIQTYNTINYSVFEISPVDNVMIGIEDWLYYHTDQDGVTTIDFIGKAQYSYQDLETMSDEIQQVTTALGDTKIVYMMTPAKQTIYPEYLPPMLQQQRGQSTRADQYGELFDQLEVPYIDLRAHLLDRKLESPYPLYYQGDTHWNRLGAYEGYRFSLNSLGLPIRNIKGKTIETKSSEGDLVNMIGIPHIIDEKVVSIELEVEPSFQRKKIVAENKDVLVTENPDYLVDQTVVVFHDSFFQNMIPYMASTFRTVYYVPNFTRDLITESKVDFQLISYVEPDLVIYEFTERYSDVLKNHGNRLDPEQE